jgi:ABC-type multidrug transport system ATPase subunit
MYSAQESALTHLFSIEQHFRAYMDVYGGQERYPQVVDQLSLAEMIERRPQDVSGGERQRVSLGLAVLRAPTCLLMDEPFSGVAPLDLPLVMDGLRSLRAQGTALIVSGHDVEALLEVADDIVWVVAGTTHALGAPAAARRHHQFAREYLGPRGGVRSAGK